MTIAKELDIRGKSVAHQDIEYDLGNTLLPHFESLKQVIADRLRPKDTA